MYIRRLDDRRVEYEQQATNDGTQHIRHVHCDQLKLAIARRVCVSIWMDRKAKSDRGTGF